MKTIRLQILLSAMALSFLTMLSTSTFAQTVVNAGPDSVEVCSGEIVGLGGSISAGTATWVGGLGNFDPNRNTLNPLYTPAPSEYGTTVTLTLREDAAPNATDIIKIVLLETPVLVVTPPIVQNVCPSTSVNLSSAIVVNDTVGTTGFITYFDDGGSGPGNQIGGSIVSPPVGVPTIFYIFKTTFTTPSCFDFEPVTVFITACAACTPPTPTGTPTNASCNGSADGGVDVSVSGGVSPYLFAWSNGATTEDINGVTAGTYTLTVTDSTLCDTTVQFTVGEPAALNTSVTPIGNLIGCKPFSVLLAAQAGFTAYSWSSGETTQFITVTTTDSITVTVTDGSGCSATSSVIATRAVNPRKLGGAFCGRMDLNTNDVIYAEKAWSSPYTTQYEWELKNKATLAINNYVTAGRTLDLSTTIVEDSATYRVRVRLVINSLAQCWGDSCMIGFIPKTTINAGSLIPFDCNKPAAPRSFVVASLVEENGTTPARQYEYNWYADAGLDTLVSSVIRNGRMCPFSVVTGIASGVTYYVTVRGKVPFSGIGTGGWGPVGPACSVTPQSLTRMANESLLLNPEEDFTAVAAPNPFSETFTLYIDALSDIAVNVQLLDIAGRLVQEISSVNPMSPIVIGTDLNSGIYFVRVTQGTSSQVIKMIKTDY